MTPSLVLGFALAGWCSGEPPVLRPNAPLLRLPQVDDRESLERARRGVALVEESIKLGEKILSEDPDSFTPEQAGRLRRDLMIIRADLEKMKKWMRELEWCEQQRNLKPGLVTEAIALERLRKLRLELWPETGENVAPMPREVKK